MKKKLLSCFLIDALWGFNSKKDYVEPSLQTPHFPEYTCGHSTCSPAAGLVIDRLKMKKS